jgi:hypothetical protein
VKQGSLNGRIVDRPAVAPPSGWFGGDNAIHPDDTPQSIA